MNRFTITPLTDWRYYVLDSSVPRFASRIVGGRTILYTPRFCFETTRGACNCIPFLEARTICEHIEAIRDYTDNIHAGATQCNKTGV